jgi:hypothetical protein
MGGRTLQLTLLIVLGAGLALLVLQPWGPAERVRMPALPSPSRSATSVSPGALPRTDPKAISPPPTRTFHLPAVASAAPAVRSEPAPQDPPQVMVPKDWMLRGSGPENYDVRSDRSEVFSGQSSVLFASRKKDIPYTESGSLMQSVIADPWLGKRVVFTVSWKRKGFRQYVQLWVRALDASRVVVAYNESGAAYAKEDWHRNSVAIDIPWSATEIAYGVSLKGPGQMNIDDAHFEVVDKAADVAARNLTGHLGIVAQETSDKGPLASPSNMDFEDIVPALASFRELPRDQLGRSRF